MLQVDASSETRQIIRRPRLQQGERVRGGITSSKGQEVITSSKGQEARKQERRSKKQEAFTGNKRQEARNNKPGSNKRLEDRSES